MFDATTADSGIGRAVAVLYAREGRRAILMPGDVTDPGFCFLASLADSSYITGDVLLVLGGQT